MTGHCLTHRFRWLLLVLPLWLAFAGCDNNPHARPWQAKRDDGSPWKVAYRPFPEDPRTLDPQVAYDEVSHMIINLCYDTFLSYEPFNEKYVLTPCIASELPVREDHADGSVSYLCKLKPGIYFQDDPCFPGGKGRELTSDDFLYTWKRIADPKALCPIVGTLGEFVAGLQAAYEQAQKTGKFDYAAPFPGVTVVDRYTFRINLVKPYPQIRYWLAFAFTIPVAHEAVAYYDGAVHDGKVRDLFRAHPVGTGPFQLKEWRSGNLIRLVRNPHYSLTFPNGGWSPDMEAKLRPYAGKPLPLLDEIQLLIIKESIPAWVLFRQGWLDTVGLAKDNFNTVLTPEKTLLPAFAKQGMQLIKNVEPSTWYLMFNMKDPVIGKNVKLRHALSQVFDAEKENDIFLFGTWALTQQFVPPGLFGYDPGYQNPYRHFDVAAAKKQLAEAGYPNGIDPQTGKPLELTMDTQAADSLLRQRAEFEKQQFEQLGIRVTIRENTFASMLERQLRGTYQFLMAGWSADYPDPENYFFLLYGPNLPPNGYNQAFYQNPEFDAIFQKMATLEDSPERAAYIKQLNDIITRDMPIAPLFNSVRMGLAQPWTPRIVKNYYVSQFGGARYTILDTEMRDRIRAERNRKNYWPLIIAAALLAGVVIFGIRRSKPSHV